jgi:hypothetical protein
MLPKTYYASFIARNSMDRLLSAPFTTNSVWWRGHRAGSLLITDVQLTKRGNGAIMIMLEFSKRKTHRLVVNDLAEFSWARLASFAIYHESRFQDIVPSRVKLRRRKRLTHRRNDLSPP